MINARPDRGSCGGSAASAPGKILTFCTAAVLVGWACLAPGIGGTRPAPKQSGYLVWYLQNGVWKSDAHSLAAAICYLVEPEPALPSTNPPTPPVPVFAGTNGGPLTT